jgi:tetratricopeptide (TPR) repeat protein
MLAAERAYEADAFMSDARVILFRLCQMSLELKNWEAVTRWCGEGRRRFPDRASFVSVEIAALAGPEGPSPDAAHAWELAGKTLELSPPQTRAEREALALMQVAAVLARAGLGDSARAVIGRARAVAPGPDPDLFYQEANAWLRLGQTDTALSLLAAYLEAQPDQRDYIAGDWWWAELRDDPRFQSLVAPSPGR